MKRIVFLLLGIALASQVMSQNGGQSNENQSLKIRVVGLNPSGQAGVEVLNKKPCDVSVGLQLNNQKWDVQLGPNGKDTVWVPAKGKIQAKPDNGCPGDQGDQGQVELIVDQHLPILWGSKPIAKWLDNHTLLVTFEVSDASGVNHFQIRVSPDGRNWKNIMIVFPHETPDGKYSIKVKL